MEVKTKTFEGGLLETLATLKHWGVLNQVHRVRVTVEVLEEGLRDEFQGPEDQVPRIDFMTEINSLMLESFKCDAGCGRMVERLGITCDRCKEHSRLSKSIIPDELLQLQSKYTRPCMKCIDGSDLKPGRLCSMCGRVGKDVHL